jgi:hypothetical protein
MSNLFNFNYESAPVLHLNGDESRFVNIWGQGGKVVHTGKKGYKMISTESLSMVGDSLADRGLLVKPFIHKNGEVLGLNIKLKGSHMTAVGDKTYEALITCPNNGTGQGYLSLREVRLICTNGLVRSSVKKMAVKIPHNISYPQALQLAQNAIVEFKTLIEEMNLLDKGLNEKHLEPQDVRFHLNKWFFYNELPVDQKEGLSFDEFRHLAALDEFHKDHKFAPRYYQLMAAYNRELTYNESLGLSLSQYTVLGAVTNYLSRRQEDSKSSAPAEIQYLRQQSKTNAIINQLVKA